MIIKIMRLRSSTGYKNIKFKETYVVSVFIITLIKSIFLFLPFLSFADAKEQYDFD